MALLDWISSDHDLRLAGERVRLRPHRSSDFEEWAALRETSRTTQVRETYHRLHNVGAHVIGVVLSGVPTRTYAYKYGSYGYHQTVS